MPFETLLTQLIQALPGLVAAAVILLLTLYFSGLAGRAMHKAMILRNASTQAALIMTKVARYTVAILGVIVAFQQVGFNLTAFLTGLGIVGFAVGFALQDVSKNFVSGLLLLIEQPFQIGDAIKVTDYEGTVIAIDLRATEMHTFDGQVVLIPNSTIFTNPITNYSRSTRRRVEISFAVAAESDLEQIRNAALQAIRSTSGLLEKPGPDLLFQNFSSSKVNVSAYFWVDTKKIDPMAAQDAAMIEVSQAFKVAGISLV